MSDALREAAQQALDALESLQGGCTDSGDGTVEAITVWCPEVIDALRAALSAPPPVVPAGWRLVPVEPTPEMLVAINWPNDPAGYRAMLAAAPQAPTQREGD